MLLLSLLIDSLVRMEQSTMLVLGAWVAVEVLFFALITFGWKRSMDRQLPTPDYRIPPVKLITRVLDMVESLPQGAYSFKRFIEGWFLGAPLETIHRDNVLTFLAWAMYNQTLEDARADAQRAKDMNGALAEFERRARFRFPSGFNSAVSCVKFTLEPAACHVVHRPLLLYVGVAVTRLCAHGVLLLAGYIRYQENGLSYWYRPSARPAGALEPLPFVFFHGIGPGVFIYLPLVRFLVSGRCSVIFDMPNIGMGLQMKPLSRDQFIATVTAVLHKHGIARACVAGHSFGSICAGWVVQERPELVAQLVLLDPVSLMLALPDVAFNFLYRDHCTLEERLISAMASTEVGIANTLRRHFWWFNNCLWLDDIEDIPTVVHLASADRIAPAALQREYLRHCKNVELIYSEGFRHGQILFSLKKQQELARRMFLQEARLFAFPRKIEALSTAEPADKPARPELSCRPVSALAPPHGDASRRATSFDGSCAAKALFDTPSPSRSGPFLRQRAHSATRAMQLAALASALQ